MVRTRVSGIIQISTAWCLACAQCLEITPRWRGGQMLGQQLGMGQAYDTSIWGLGRVPQRAVILSLIPRVLLGHCHVICLSGLP